MSHHSATPPDFGDENDPAFQARQKLMRELLNTTGFRGATGHFPNGQMSKHDEGAIQFAIGEQDGKVVMDFGTPVHWFGMTPEEAADLASLLLKRAREVGRKQGKTITFSLGV